MLESRRADLHVHTAYSDGTLTPEECVKCAKDRGLDCIAICDHDSVNGVAEALSAGKDHEVEVVPAVEVSAEEDGREMHILGYYIDHKDKTLLSFLKQIRDDRKKRLYKIVDSLNAHGLNMDAEDIIAFTGDVSISRLHVAKYMQAKNIISDWRQAFSKYIGDDKPCYVSSFRYTSKQVIDLIKQAKGVSVIAHPGVNKLNGIMQRLVDEGIQGVEVYHTDHKNSAVKKYAQFANEHGLMITGGSDCHGRAKGEPLMGTTTIDYSYVEALKDASQI